MPCERTFFRFIRCCVPTTCRLPVHAFGEWIAAAYVCENFACQMPTTDPAGLAELLK